MESMPKAIAAAVVVVMLVNAVGAIVGGIWLAVAGDWSAIGWGFAWLLVGPWIAGLISMIPLIFGLPAATAAEKGAFGAARILGGLSGLLLGAGMLLLSLLVTGFFLGKIREAPMLPTLLWTYSAATAPWAFLASKEDNEFATISIFFLEAGYIVGALLVMLDGGNLSLLTWSLIVAVGANWVFQQYLAGQMMRARAP